MESGFGEEKDVGGFAEFDGTELGVQFEFAGVVDGGGFEDLSQREAAVVELLHFEIAVEDWEVSVSGREGISLPTFEVTF